MRRLLLATVAVVLVSVPAFAASSDVLARMEGKDITRGNVESFIKDMPPQIKALPPAILEPMALDQLINDQLILNAAKAEDIQNSKEFKKREAELKDQLIREVYIKDRIDSKVTESAMKEEYSKLRRENPEDTEYEARHMLVDSKENAEDLIKQVNDGADFAKLAGKNNKGPEKEKGGELGYITAREVVPEFGDALKKMKVGEVMQQPVKTQFGWHVIQLENKRKREMPKYEAVKEQLRQQVMQKYAREEIEKLRKDAKVEVFADNLKQMPQSGAPKGADGQTGKKAN